MIAAYEDRAVGGTVRAYRALIGLDFVLFRDDRPVAWRIGGGRWKYDSREARDIVARFGEREEEVPDWAKVYEDLYP